MMRAAFFISWTLLFGTNGWGDQVDEFELETETSFFEAQNAEGQLDVSKDLLLKEQLETNAAERRAEEVSARAQEMKKKIQAEREKVERQRAVLAKQKAKYQKEIQVKEAEIKKRDLELQQDRATLAALAKEVRDLKRKNLRYQERINAQKRSNQQIKQYMAEGKKQKKSQQEYLVKRQNILQSLGRKSESSPRRQPSSVGEAENVNVTLVRQKKRK